MNAGSSMREGGGGVLHVRVGTAGLDHLSEWASPDAPEWSAYRDLSYGYGRLELNAQGNMLFEFVRTGLPRHSGHSGEQQQQQRHHPLAGVVDRLELKLSTPEFASAKQRPAGQERTRLLRG